MKQKRSGFTLIELLVAIFIILVLIALLTVGLRALTASANERATRQMLANCVGMMTEMDARVPLARSEVGTYVFLNTYTQPVAAPGKVLADHPDRLGPAVQRTGEVLKRFRQLPNNKKVFEQLPQEKVMSLPGVTPGTQVAVLLDAWNNPIIFVTPGGLSGVRLKDAGVITRLSPDGKPFFASAGPDGDFQTGDDNLYSFEN